MNISNIVKRLKDEFILKEFKMEYDHQGNKWFIEVTICEKVKSENLDTLGEYTVVIAKYPVKIYMTKEMILDIADDIQQMALTDTIIQQMGKSPFK